MIRALYRTRPNDLYLIGFVLGVAAFILHAATNVDWAFLILAVAWAVMGASSVVATARRYAR